MISVRHGPPKLRFPAEFAYVDDEDVGKIKSLAMLRTLFLRRILAPGFGDMSCVVYGCGGVAEDFRSTCLAWHIPLESAT